MDQDGFAQFASIRNLAHRARVSEEDTAAAVAILESPDTESSDPDNDGKRVEKVPGGWMILNSQKYKDLVTAAFARESVRVRVKRHRDKKANVTLCNVSTVTCNASETDAETDTKEEGSPDGSLPSFSTNGESAKGLVVRKKPSPIPERLAFLEVWKSAYRNLTGREYIYSYGKDGKAIDFILLNIGQIEAIRVAGLAWKSSDPFIRKCSASIASFSSQWNTIIIAVECNEKPISNRGKI